MDLFAIRCNYTYNAFPMIFFTWPRSWRQSGWLIPHLFYCDLMMRELWKKEKLPLKGLLQEALVITMSCCVMLAQTSPEPPKATMSHANLDVLSDTRAR
jgi:hypothetical protein